MTHEDERTNQAPITDPARNSPGLREDHTSEHVPLTGSFVEHDPEDDELLLGLDGERFEDWFNHLNGKRLTYNNLITKKP